MSDLPAGYKQTEVGVIPEDWDATRLRNIGDIKRGASPRPIDSPVWFDEQSQIGWLRISDVTKSSKYLKDTMQNLSALGVKHSRYVERNNLVMSICATVGRPILTRKNVCIHDGFVVFSNLKIDKEYLYYILSSIEKDWSKHGQTGSQMNLNTELINSTVIPLPPTKAEQTAIATALSDADALIQSLEKLIAKKRNIKQGAMQELLKPKEGWVVKMLGEIFSITAGGDLRKDEFSSVNDEKYCYPIYSNALTNAGLYGYCSSYDHQGDCITVTARGTVGFANLRNHKFSAIGRLLILKPIEKLNCVFIAEYINLKVEFANESTGVPQLTAPQISKYEVVIPDYTKQTSIATILSDMDTETSALETKLAKYKQVKHGMMQELLTGKTRLI